MHCNLAADKYCMMKPALLVVALLFSASCFAQSNSDLELKQMQSIEYRIRPFADSMIFAQEWIDRFRADSTFTRGLVQALKTPNSFYYNFDSIKTISKLYAPDSSFKIFTWQIMKDFSFYRQRGAIQMKTSDGSLKLFPLFDFSDFTTAPNDSVRDARHWIGAIYYKIVLKTFAGKNYYTLIGSDENDERSNKKWIDVLWFDDNNQPQFGGKFFSYPPNDPTKPKGPVYRFCIEYKKDGGVRLNYDARYDAIIFDHLTSETDEIQNKATLIPVGDFEAFKWINGKWVFNDNPFKNVIFGDNQSTFPAPLFDERGKIDEKKLSDQSKKNQQKTTVPPIPNPNKINDKINQYKPGESSNN